MSEEKKSVNKVLKQTKIKPLTEEQKALCEEWKDSGIKREQFCSEHKIPTSTFYGWCAKLWPSTKLKETLFIPVSPIKAMLPKQDKEEGIVEIRLPMDATVKVTLPLKEIASLLQELCYATAIIR